jgi:hypothetical protein
MKGNARQKNKGLDCITSCVVDFILIPCGTKVTFNFHCVNSPSNFKMP